MYGESRNPDLFGGDFYGGNDGVTRGVSLARINPSVFDKDEKVFGEDKVFEKDPFASDKVPANFAFDSATQRIRWGATTVELARRPLEGPAATCGAAPTLLLNTVLEYFGNNCDGYIEEKPHKNSLKAFCCHEYQLLKIKVAFFAPEHAPHLVAMSWSRKAGDGVAMVTVMNECVAFVRQRGIEISHAQVPFQALCAPAFPDMMQGETTPSSFDSKLLPKLVMEPCTAEELAPLLELVSEDAGAKEEATRGLLAMLLPEESIDAPTVVAALRERPDIVERVLAEPACVLASPALVTALVARDAYDECTAARLLCAGLVQEPSRLGKRQLARALGSIVPAMRVEKLQECDWMTEKLAELRCDVDDKPTLHYLNEATISLSVLGDR